MSPGAYLGYLAEVTVLFMEIGRALQTVTKQHFFLIMHIILNVERMSI